MPIRLACCRIACRATGGRSRCCKTMGFMSSPSWFGKKPPNKPEFRGGAEPRSIDTGRMTKYPTSFAEASLPDSSFPPIEGIRNGNDCNRSGQDRQGTQFEWILDHPRCGDLAAQHGSPGGERPLFSGVEAACNA